KSQNGEREEQGQQSQNQQESENKTEKQKTEQHRPKRGEKQAQVQPKNTHRDDPEFRRLEAVESARDPSFLIRAQMQLQAQQKQPPQQSQKEW
ncbi:TPA: hypothetical protein ACVOY8_002811, partial [Vibrio diabolicus]